MRGRRERRDAAVGKHMQTPAAEVARSRRKWSDWSECSTECLRTRHRLNCDDLIGELEVERYSQAISKVARGALSDSARIKRENAARSQQDQPDDDQDYADEGDEGDEDDSCANVETSKTFEQQACVSGQCKSPSSGEFGRTPPAGLGGGISGAQATQRHRARTKGECPFVSGKSIRASGGASAGEQPVIGAADQSQWGAGD